MKTSIQFIAIFVLSLLSACTFSGNQKALRVGTTGDYAPLSVKAHNGYQGYSVDIIKAFAKAENYQIEFVPTKWATLSEDLKNDRFSIAVGGISKNPQRAAQFLLTDAVTGSGKIALIRCSDRKQYSESASKLIKQLNQSSVRIVENKGGTNAVFARENFPKAKISYVNNNELPFSYLAEKKADVMITDLLEGNYKAKNGGYAVSLCVANPDDPFDHFDKVFMARKDSSNLVHTFNNWMKKPETQQLLKEKKKEWL